MQTATETRRPFDLWTVDTNGEHVERIATGSAYTDEVHRLAWIEAIETGETIAIVWQEEGVTSAGVTAMSIPEHDTESHNQTLLEFPRAR